MTRDEQVEKMKAIMHKGLALADSNMKNNGSAEVMFMVCTLVEFFKKEMPKEFGLMVRIAAEMNKDIEKKIYNA